VKTHLWDLWPKSTKQFLGKNNLLRENCFAETRFFYLFSASASDEKAVRALEEENNKLRDLLREAQQEIVNLNNSNHPATATNKVHVLSLPVILS